MPLDLLVVKFCSCGFWSGVGGRGGEMATVATAAAAAARHNAALLVPKVGFFFGFFSSETLELGFLFVLWKGGERSGGRDFCKK